MSRFKNKVALVTGAGSGIGEAIAKELAADGATVVATDINLQAAQKVAAAIAEAGGQATALEHNVAEPADSERVVEAAVKEFGGLHLAVNNAGIGGAAGHTADVAPADWGKVININLNGVFYGMRYQIPAMLAAGGGSIVNIASIHGMVATPLGGNSAYVAAKHGVVGLTRNAAAEYGTRGVRVNAVGPGYIDTPLLGGLPEEARTLLIGKHPIGRLGHAEDVSHLTTFLLSDAASFITGAYNLVDGGFTAL